MSILEIIGVTWLYIITVSLITFFLSWFVMFLTRKREAILSLAILALVIKVCLVVSVVGGLIGLGYLISMLK